MTAFHILIAQIISWTNVAVMVFVAVICSLAFFHCLAKTKAIQFQRAFKRTRNFWMIATGISCAVTVLTGAPAFLSALSGGVILEPISFVPLITATVCGVYLADVKPAVDVESQGPSPW